MKLHSLDHRCRAGRPARIGLVWWSNKQEAAKAGQACRPNAPPRSCRFKDGDIRQIEVDHRGGENTVVKKNDAGQWQIVSPKTLPPIRARSDSLASAVSSVSSERVVDETSPTSPDTVCRRPS